MASTTKIMTGLLMLEHFRTSIRSWPRGATRSASARTRSTCTGERLTVDQLLQALLIQSANDAAADLADAVAGDQAHFVALMNQRARELGLTNTHYMNPHGLDRRATTRARATSRAWLASPCATALRGLRRP